MIDKLNRLDERLRLRRPVTQGRWSRSLRLWWVAPLLAMGVLVLAQIAVAVWDFEFHPMSFLAFIPVVFASGFFYAHRLTQLGQQSGWRQLWQPTNDD